VRIFIDPGKTGAICCQDSDGRVWVDDMPDTIGDLWEYFKAIDPSNSCAYLENVGGYMPGNSGPAAVKFAKHMGFLEMALYAAGIPTTKVAPQVWMKALGVPKFAGTKEKQKTLRKNWIRDYSQRKFPNLKIKVSQGDSVGLLCFVLKGK